MRADHALADRAEITWAEAAQHALCALTPDMQNRRIIDAAFAEAGRAPTPMIESNSVIALCAHLESGGFACVLPEYFLTILGGSGRLRAIPLVAPAVAHTVGIVALDRDPQPTLLAALIEVAAGVEAALAAALAEARAPLSSAPPIPR